MLESSAVNEELDGVKQRRISQRMCQCTWLKLTFMSTALCNSQSSSPDLGERADADFPVNPEKTHKICGNTGQSHTSQKNSKCSKERRNTETCVMNLQVSMKITSKSSTSQQGVALLLSPFSPNMFVSWKMIFLLLKSTVSDTFLS